MLRVGARLLGRAGAAILKPAGRLQCSALQPRAKLLKACRAVPGHRLQAAPPQLSRLSGEATRHVLSPPPVTRFAFALLFEAAPRLGLRLH